MQGRDKMKTEKIALIAGSGKYPLLFARKAKESGNSVVAIALKNETSPVLAGMADRTYWINTGELGKLIEICRKEQISKAVMAGRVDHAHLYEDIIKDKRTIDMLSGTKDRKANSILAAIADALAGDNIELVSPKQYLPMCFVSPGVLTLRNPARKDMEDIEFGYRIAKEIARLDIGLTVVVKDKAVLAVEAMDGTDSTIRRGGKLGRGNVIVVKVSRPDQDMRFDLPVIGENTVRTLKKSRANVLAFSSGKTVVLDREKMVKMCDRWGIILVALRDN